MSGLFGGTKRASFNSVARTNPNNMPRPGTGGSMQAAFIRGDQRSSVSSKRKQQTPLANSVNLQKKTKAATDAFWPDEPEFVEQSDAKRFYFEPSDSARTVPAGSTVKLGLAVSGAYDIEWRAFTPADDDERVVPDDGTCTIVDNPVQDTVYEVRYKVVRESVTEKHGSVLRTHGKRLAVYFTVLQENVQ